MSNAGSIKQVYAELTKVVNLLNAAGIAHMDLRPANILWKVNNSTNTMSLQVIDFEDVCFFGTFIDNAEALKNDARYPIHPSDSRVLIQANSKCNEWFLNAVSEYLNYNDNVENTSFTHFMNKHYSDFESFYA